MKVLKITFYEKNKVLIEYLKVTYTDFQIQTIIPVKTGKLAFFIWKTFHFIFNNVISLHA